MSDHSFSSLPSSLGSLMKPGLLQRPAVQQFLKFCIIGFSSLFIDAGISWFLTFHAHLNPTPAKMISFPIAVTNGFFWNRMWTFRGMGGDRLHQMYLKFFAVNVIGFGLNLTIFKTVLFAFTGRFLGQGKPEKIQFLIATILAAGCVSVWNFLANKKWTFNG